MNNHLFFPGAKLNKLVLPKEYKSWLTQWLQDLEPFLDSGNVASSMCLEGALSEIVLYGKLKTDWIGIMDQFLTAKDGSPLAYSKKYSECLYKFDQQWHQVTVHAVHTRWWLEQITNEVVPQQLLELTESFIQSNGWVYNPDVSPTNLRTRMRSEILMSLAMATEIFYIGGVLEDKREKIEANISSMSVTDYISAEFFRALCLSLLGSPKLIPQEIGSVIVNCMAGEGFCDFCMEEKKDDYMGSAKRSSRDSAVHSAFTTLQVVYLLKYIKVDQRKKIIQKVNSFIEHLNDDPMDIPAFQIRDINIPFGESVTPIEIISATLLLNGDDLL